MPGFHNLMLTNKRTIENTQISKQTYQHFPQSTLENVSANYIKLMKQI